MSPLAKLAGFAVAAGLIFAGAAFAGSRIDVHPGKPDTEKAVRSRVWACSSTTAISRFHMICSSMSPIGLVMGWTP